MAFVEKTVSIEASPDAVWAIGGDVGAVHLWVDSIESARVEGDLRYATLDQGRGEMIERITSRSDQEMALTYELVTEGAPMRLYRARFAVEEADGGALAIWSAELEPADGVDEDALVSGVEANYERGLENLRRLATEG